MQLSDIGMYINETKHAVTPKIYKSSCLKGGIFQCYYTTRLNVLQVE